MTITLYEALNRIKAEEAAFDRILTEHGWVRSESPDVEDETLYIRNDAPEYVNRNYGHPVIAYDDDFDWVYCNYNVEHWLETNGSGAESLQKFLEELHEKT